MAIVTGAARGIGLAVAHHLGASGLAVVAVDIDADTPRDAPLPEHAQVEVDFRVGGTDRPNLIELGDERREPASLLVNRARGR